VSKRIIAMLVGALAIAVIAGCGGGSDSSSTSGESTSSGDGGGSSISKAEFIKKADAICAKGSETANEEAEEFAEDNNVDTENPTPEQLEEVVSDVVAPNIQIEAEEIAALGAPQGDEAEVEAIVNSVEEAVSALEGDPSKVGEGESPLAEATKLAKSYGLKNCGEA
jgi:hypothetical protein